MTAIFFSLLLAMGWGTEAPSTAAVGWGTEAPR